MMQKTLSAARANESKLLREEQEMQAEKKATLADSDQFFETAAKMQNSNDQLKQELATEKQNEAALNAKVAQLTQQMDSQATASKFQEQQLLDRLTANNDKLSKDEAILKRFRAQVQQMADAQRASAQAHVAKAVAKPVKKTVAPLKKTGKTTSASSAIKKVAKKNAASKVAHEPSKPSTKSTPSTPSMKQASHSKLPKPAANATKRLRGSA
jgi:hypothetical protein